MPDFLDPVEGTLISASPEVWRPAGSMPLRMARAARGFDPGLIDQASFSLWRYREMLQLDVEEQTWQRTQMGEGATALAAADTIAPGLFMKMEFAMPTLSFKDRGVAVIMAQAAQWGVDEVVVDSSGNAATSVAAYAARLGMRAHVFVPADTSDGKLGQIAAHGATIHKISGTREDTGQAAHAFLDGSKAFYASHIYNPLFHQGTKTMVFEIWEQLGGQLPDTLLLPVGNGTMLIGAIIGLQEILAAGWAESMPQIIAVQSEACAPIATAFAAGGTSVESIRKSETIAEGIAIAAPARGAEILERLRAADGRVHTVTDDEVRAAQSRLAAAGFYVEPTAAVCMAAWSKLPIPQGRTVIPLCGAGLKSKK